MNAGYNTQNVIEIIGGIATKTIANLTNKVAKTGLDEAMLKYMWKPSKKKIIAEIIAGIWQKRL